MIRLPKDIKFSNLYKKMNILSFILIFLSILILIIKGLNLGVDFKGGTLIEVRTENNKKVFSAAKKLPEFHSTYIFEEAIGCSIMSIKGKIIQLPILFLLRQRHPNQFFSSIDFYEWLTDENWHKAFKIFEKETLSHLIEIDQITREEASKIFKKVFC